MPLSKIDYYGLSIDFSECEKKLSEIQSSQQEAMNTLKQKGCQLEILCKCCTKKDAGNMKPAGLHSFEENSKKSTITICANHTTSIEEMDKIFYHELVHAFQSCNSKKKTSGCDQSICREMQAYYRSSKRADKNLGEEELKSIVKNGVVNSSRQHCPGMTEDAYTTHITNYIRDNWDKCVSKN